MKGDEELLTYTSRFLAWSATCNDSGAWGGGVGPIRRRVGEVKTGVVGIVLDGLGRFRVNT
jgi:hypothetical protein